MRAVIAVLAIVLFGASVLSALVEARPNFQRAQTLAQQVSAVETIRPGSMPISRFESGLGRNIRLRTCVDAVNSISRSHGAEAVPRDLAAGCLAIAQAIVARAPLHSNGWLMAAILANRLGDRDAMRRYLLRSFETGPNEQWIAERRALFAWRERAELSPDLTALLDRDFLLLLRTRQGVEVLARQFVSNEGLRERLVSLAETTEPEFQRRFLERVRATVNASRP